MNYIKEPTISLTPTRYRQNSMIPLVERAGEKSDHQAHHHNVHSHGSSTLPRAESAGVGGLNKGLTAGRLHARSHSSDSVYTILIRLPHDPSPDGPLHPPSILMIEEEAASEATGCHPGGGGLRYSRGASPLVRRGDSVCSDPSGGTNSRLECSLHPGGPDASPLIGRRISHNTPDIKLPLNAKIIPKQLAKNTGSGGSNSAAPTGKKKKKKKSTEKKQDRKAAKTLSAILLAFIVTWTPYNVLVLLKTVLACNPDCIPPVLWNFAYYLCYINSTINPMCYALCNAAFRRTYVRILTCKWHSRRRQGVQRGFYS